MKNHLLFIRKPMMCVLALLVASCSQSTGLTQATEIETASTASADNILVATSANTTMDHSHIPLEIPANVETPSLSLAVSRDWMSGLNLQVHTANYIMTPPPSGLSMIEAMKPSIDAETGFAEGHAHLYINGIKVQRIYGPNLHLPEALFKPGLNQINVTINNHGHMYWTAAGRQVMATLFIDLDDFEDLVTYRFESYPALKSAGGSMCKMPGKRETG